MINLLHACPAGAELRRIFSEHPPVPLLPPLGDPRWSAALSNPVTAGLRDGLLERACAERDEPLPVLTDELYRDYSATGVRVRFEVVYFERRRRLARAAVALLAGGGEAATRSFLDKLEEIFAEVSWALPAHVDNPDGRDPQRVDLFGAETANLMGECLNVFGAIIPVDFKTRILERLRRDFFENYRDRGDAMWWTKMSHNWNAVCHQGVLGAALAVEDDPQLLADLVTAVISRLPLFLDGYGPDGGCSEGPGYWEYGFGWFATLNEQLEVRTGGEFSLFEGDAKVRNIARYAPLVSLSARKLVNFADSPSEEILRPQVMAYVARRLGVKSCALQVQENYAQLAERGVNYDAERSDLFYWLRLFLHAPTSLAPAGGGLKEDIYFDDLGVWVVRGRDAAGRLWELAAKGGDNEEHHNHNDLGSFILNLDGVPLIMEIGAPEYTRDFFSWQKRYSFLAARSLGHSVPVINGCEQPEGVDFQAKVIRADTNADAVVFEVDLTKAYPAAAGCRRCVRRLSWVKSAGRLTWDDRFELEKTGSLESAIITEGAEVDIVSPQIAVVSKEGRRLALEAGVGASWVRVETHAYRGHLADDRTIRRLVLAPASVEARMTLTVTITPGG